LRGQLRPALDRASRALPCLKRRPFELFSASECGMMSIRDERV
jgi:hypothetical protein